MYNAPLMVTCSGSLATISCELRQVRKEATVAVISGAEVRLGQVTTLFSMIGRILAVIQRLSSIDSTDVFLCIDESLIVSYPA
jgi:hypothetical protein